VLINGTTIGPDARRRLGSTTRVTTTTTQALFSMIASPKKNIRVVVINVDSLGLQPITDVRLLFPNVRIVAIARSASMQGRAKAAGAAAATSPKSATLVATIRRLAHPNCRTSAPAAALQRTLNTVLAQQTITFEPGKAVLTPAGRATLDHLLVTLKRYPHAKVRIEGYTDSDGDSASNLALSRARAKTVRLYFIHHGIRDANLRAIGFGENRPVASNRTAGGKAKNRRIELKVTSS
jgi:outer membrane protein OmpA-like peptidoglycan-associated protein